MWFCEISFTWDLSKETDKCKIYSSPKNSSWNIPLDSEISQAFKHRSKLCSLINFSVLASTQDVVIKKWLVIWVQTPVTTTGLVTNLLQDNISSCPVMANDGFMTLGPSWYEFKNCFPYIGLEANSYFNKQGSGPEGPSRFSQVCQIPGLWCNYNTFIE